MRFTKELAEEFYEDRRDEAAFPQLIGYMTSGDCMVLCLGRENGISHWRSLIGPAKVSAAKKSVPKSLRAVFGDAADDTRNAVHGSESPGAAGREIDLIFPNIIAEAEWNGDNGGGNIKHHSLDFTTAATPIPIHS